MSAVQHASATAAKKASASVASNDPLGCSSPNLGGLLGSNSVFAIDGADRRRRLLTPLLQNKSCANFEEIRRPAVDDSLTAEAMTGGNEYRRAVTTARDERVDSGGVALTPKDGARIAVHRRG